LFRGEATVVCLAQPNGLGSEKDCHSGATPRPFVRRPFIGANDRGVAPKNDLPENPARWAGLGKQPGALPLKIVIQIRKIAPVLTY